MFKLYLDFCDPNPCLNGGTCVPSKWSKRPYLISCICIGIYGGKHCEVEELQRCYLPQDPGRLKCIENSRSRIQNLV